MRALPVAKLEPSLIRQTVAIVDDRATNLKILERLAMTLMERVEVLSKKSGEVREQVISADTLLTWAEFQTVETPDHPTPLPDWNFSCAFPGLPNRYRRPAHQGCDRQSTRISHRTPEMARIRQKAREARHPHGF